MTRANPPGWLVGGASVRGSAHVRTGRPNQDAIGWSPPPGSGSRIVAAVSDGHGAALHVRSGEGARIAVDQAVEIIAWHMDDGGQDEGSDGPAADILAGWRTAVAAHATAHPYCAGEHFDASIFTAYGATLLCLGASDDLLAMVQIGDGDLMLGYPGGRLERPLGADTGLVGEQTYSLCLATAAERFRTGSIRRAGDAEWPDFALLASDGVAKSFRDDAAFAGVVQQLRALAATDWQAMLAALPDWLATISENGSGDDSSLCIAIRTTTGEPQP